ncbi:MAG TPA: response regulator [Deltaproteobacteria bacterium]|jgi:response regulator RpfG family c-di-GMP phosphodiesterase|nr:response regulator [Deltaproteobacteria bacterium]MDI9541713.1 response regulator [Pseudomonadota bacterium]HNU75514.1 response regulator [Deltaproteobacteria bacterium]HOD70249.1 response regulator [Deltaproteobacteria bacterium]HOE72492.1 response regulator [Deltaproteobacteria bacterium]
MDGLTKTLPLLKELRILIVDDSAVVRSVLSKELLRSGVQVTQAENGQQALDIALRKEFDLIITDVEMPCMNGIELCRRLKSDPRTQQIPIVILSSLDSEEDIRKGFLAGASTYITKAQAKESLIETIETVLQKTTFQRGRLILVVDDSSTVRTLVEKGLKEVGFEVVKAENGRAALEILKNERPDLILSDIDMPEMNGEEFCKAVHSDPLLATIPFVVLSANNDRPIMRRMLQIGADSYLVKPFNIDQLVITVEKLLSDKLLLLYKEKERLETEQRLILASITSLCCALEARDAYTRGHSEAVASIATRIAAGMGMSREETDLVMLGGKLHDLGKIGVVDSVLLKPGKLSDEEFAIIKRHPVIGADILRPVPSLAKILPIVLYHHERIDGKGYPEGLKGDRIPLWARITAVGDTYHALTSDRPYRAGMDREKALQIIESASGTQLCPDCVEIFLKMELWAGESGDTVSDRTGGPSDEEPIALPDAAAAPARK